MYVCVCNAVPERAVHQAMAEGVSTIGALRAQLGVATGCGCCGEAIQALLQGARTMAEPVVYRPTVATASAA